MRALTSLLLSLSLACGLAIAAYAALWAMQRDPIVAPAPASAPAAPPIAAIGRLPDSPDYARTMAPAPARGDAPLAPLTVRVRHAPAAWPATDAGVAIAPARGGDGLAWFPLAAQSRDGDGWTLRHEVPAGEDYDVLLAPARPGALRSFLARASAKVAGPTEVTLDAAGGQIAFRLPDGATRFGPFRIVRDGVDGWMPAEAPTGLTLTPGMPLRVWLGAGSYRLVDVLHPDRSQAFTAPDAAEVVLSADLSAARADRP